ncbi:Prefoldin subunit-domain-containing protein [Tirmania nivea]|nr:Prefoldin subunit-domain-containing protein [Tirmania nivea]
MMNLNRRMLSQDEESPDDVEVSRADQDQINQFSTLHQKQTSLKEELETKQQEKEYLTDVTSELELADEDELVPYKIGDAFIHLPLLEVQAMLEASMAEIDKDIEAIETKLEDGRGEMNKLKVGLYAKFGKAINLEV